MYQSQISMFLRLSVKLQLRQEEQQVSLSMIEDSKVTFKLNYEITWEKTNSDENFNISRFVVVNSEDIQEQVKLENLNIKII